MDRNVETMGKALAEFHKGYLQYVQDNAHALCDDHKKALDVIFIKFEVLLTEFAFGLRVNPADFLHENISNGFVLKSGADVT